MFCDVIDKSSNPEAKDELRALGLKHLVLFSLRVITNDFEAGVQNEDNGLRVTLHLNSVETLVYTNRGGGQIEVFDLASTPARLVSSGVSSQELKSQIRSKRLRKRLESLIF